MAHILPSFRLVSGELADTFSASVLDCFAHCVRYVQWFGYLRRFSSVLDSFRRLLLQIGGANIAGADRALESAYFVVAQGWKACPLASP
jgi:hypothetical protein